MFILFHFLLPVAFLGFFFFFFLAERDFKLCVCVCVANHEQLFKALSPQTRQRKISVSSATNQPASLNFLHFLLL